MTDQQEIKRPSYHRHSTDISGDEDYLSDFDSIDAEPNATQGPSYGHVNVLPPNKSGPLSIQTIYSVLSWLVSDRPSLSDRNVLLELSNPLTANAIMNLERAVLQARMYIMQRATQTDLPKLKLTSTNSESTAAFPFMSEKIQQLVNMGFTDKEAKSALERHHYVVDTAISSLLGDDISAVDLSSNALLDLASSNLVDAPVPDSFTELNYAKANAQKHKTSSSVTREFHTTIDKFRHKQPYNHDLSLNAPDHQRSNDNASNLEEHRQSGPFYLAPTAGYTQPLHSNVVASPEPTPGTTDVIPVDNSKIVHLMSMGFSEKEARLALRKSFGNVNYAVELILQNLIY
ncbi:hypothetical protein RCL1_000913 [Eukaryota sp. TZLM3-RCL]